MEWGASFQLKAHLKRFQLLRDPGLLGQLSNNKKKFLYYLNKNEKIDFLNFFIKFIKIKFIKIKNFFFLNKIK